MAATEYDIIRDEQERNNLQRAISDLETVIAVSNPNTRRILESSLAGAKLRVSTLDKRIEEAKVERAAEVQAQAMAAVALAAKETALSARERETYRGFLEESYFTKKDFGKLDEFYKHGYDRLSEEGKEEMSQRLHEGIKRGEFRFSDLSRAVQERDNAHCSAKAVEETSHVRSNQRKEQLDSPAPTAEVKAANKISLGTLDLSGVKLAEATGSPSAFRLPDASSPQVNAR